MLPWNKNKESASASIPVQKREHDEDFSYDSMESVAEELCHAIEKKDYSAIANALRSALDLAGEEPHIEEMNE